MNNGLPVPGYRPQNDVAIDRVKRNKYTEEELLRLMDSWRSDPTIEQRWLAIARTQLEQGFMALNRAVFSPERAKLPDDKE